MVWCRQSYEHSRIVDQASQASRLILHNGLRSLEDHRFPKVPLPRPDAGHSPSLLHGGLDPADLGRHAHRQIQRAPLAPRRG